MTPKDVQFTSKDGKTVLVAKSVQLTILTTPITEFGKYGTVMIKGMATAAGTVRAFSVVHTP